MTATTPDGSVTRPVYNEANLLDAVHVSVRGGPEAPVLTNLGYNARGQRTLAEHANGTSVVYTYDERTFRLKTLVTTRASDGVRLQDLRYFYDPVGNICELHDRASTVRLFTGPAPVSSDGKYAYDSLYRLVEAQGREHPGQTQPGPVDLALGPLPHPNDLQALARYTERYTYDAVGNIERMQHLPAAGSPVPGWTRRYRYAYQVTGELASNRLLATSIPGDPDGTFSETYEYRDDATNTAGAHGSMTRMPHLPGGLDWDHADRMKRAGKLGGGDAYFTYDGAGQRVRKVYVHSGLVEERIYLGGYELYRQRAAAPGAPIDEERQTLHVMDDQRRVAMAETKTVTDRVPDAAPTTRWRFELDNHLGSAMLEVDQAGNVITYEEYHPYGTTAFHTANGSAEVSAKRYRYTGKEKDQETGLYYHGARYYAAWLGRWTAVDPAGVVDGPNLYGYARGNPLRGADPSGLQTEEEVLPDVCATTSTPECSAAAAARAEDIEVEQTLDALRETPMSYADPEREAAAQSAETTVVLSPEFRAKHARYEARRAPEPAPDEDLPPIVEEENPMYWAPATYTWGDKGWAASVVVQPLTSIAGAERYVEGRVLGETDVEATAAVQAGMESSGATAFVAWGVIVSVGAPNPNAANVTRAVESGGVAAGGIARPKGVPADWVAKPSKTGGGTRFVDPANPHNSVRVMPGDPESPFPNSRRPYVRHLKDGQSLDVNGNVVPKNAPEAHIPLEDFVWPF